MERVACRTPTPGRVGVSNIPVWKYDLLETHIRAALAGGEMTSKALQADVRGRLNPEELADLGSFGWHLCTVRLEMEVRGDIQRVPDKGPLKLRLSE
ncbi:hypothetical protein [uncultured Tateyamaria sp.]|uniref:DUF6958 family protein n=1 Tax=uncultured Tateyamaria sp. TaxID=455651 RepID=UPI0026192A72|nr:hypothetical protein [uncultured Tateyamaria sp.]